MCGIAGMIDFNGKSSEKDLRNMTNSLSHRGPDDFGYYFKNLFNSQIGLGHRRLSILDLSEDGHQPMFFDNLVIIYNGEVYNFKEIRNSLKKKGYTFNSNTDTEVIIKAYHFWGHDAISRLNGMFSIVILDLNKFESLKNPRF